MPSRPAPCPHCGITMAQVTARARSGYCLLLDQCHRCGGIWCDRWELYPLDAAEAARLDPLDERRLHTATVAAPPATPGRCPRCTTPLRRFRDPTLPADADIERCQICDGMWLNRGTLARVKRPTGDQPERTRHLTGALARTATWAQVTNLDAATYAADEPPREEETSWLAWLRTAGPWLALTALVRLLLR